MLKRTAWLPLVAGVALAPMSSTAQEFQVVVHAANPVASLSTEQIGRLFQKKVTRWDDGGGVVPIDQPTESTLRDAFTRRIYDRPTEALRSYWLKQVFSGRADPPRVVADDAAALAFVAANPNAIGYVSAGTRLTANVKAIRLVNGGD